MVDKEKGSIVEVSENDLFVMSQLQFKQKHGNYAKITYAAKQTALEHRSTYAMSQRSTTTQRMRLQTPPTTPSAVSVSSR